MKKVPSWAKELQQLLMDWAARQPKNAKVSAVARVRGQKSVSVSASYSHPSAKFIKKVGGKLRTNIEGKIRPKLRGKGWEVVFVTHKVKNNPAVGYDKGQFVMVYFNGVNVGTVLDPKLHGMGSHLGLSFTVSMYGHSVHEVYVPVP